jgi:hypothetical protein
MKSYRTFTESSKVALESDELRDVPVGSVEGNLNLILPVDVNVKNVSRRKIPEYFIIAA